MFGQFVTIRSSTQAAAGRPIGDAEKRSAVTLANSYKLRLLISLIYTFVEVMRVKGDDDTDREERLRLEFRDELNEPVGESEELLAIILFQMVNYHNSQDKANADMFFFLAADKQVR